MAKSCVFCGIDANLWGTVEGSYGKEVGKRLKIRWLGQQWTFISETPVIEILHVKY